MPKRFSPFTLLAWFCLRLAAQDADRGIAVPVTVSGGGMYTHRLNGEEADVSPAAAAFRAVLYPTLKLGPYWFAYSAIQVRSTPFFYYDSLRAAAHPESSARARLPRLHADA